MTCLLLIVGYKLSASLPPLVYVQGLNFRHSPDWCAQVLNLRTHFRTFSNVKKTRRKGSNNNLEEFKNRTELNAQVITLQLLKNSAE